MAGTTPGLGQDVDAYCTNCKMQLMHTVTAKVEDHVVRAQCNTCKKEHAYRANATAAPARNRKKSVAKRATRPRRQAVPSQYATLLGDRNPAEALPYSPQQPLRATELLDHPQFGVGVVSALKGTTKAEVVFSDSVKVLVHSLHPSQ